MNRHVYRINRYICTESQNKYTLHSTHAQYQKQNKKEQLNKLKSIVDCYVVNIHILNDFIAFYEEIYSAFAFYLVQRLLNMQFYFISIFLYPCNDSFDVQIQNSKYFNFFFRILLCLTEFDSLQKAFSFIFKVINVVTNQKQFSCK